MPEEDPKPVENKEDAPNEENKTEEGDETSSKFSFLKRYRPVLIVAGIVLVECITASFMVPSAEAGGGDLTPEQLQLLANANPDEDIAPPIDVPCIEVDMGEHVITHSSQTKGETTHVTFHLYGVIPEEDEEEFKLLYTGQENRIKDSIRAIIRKTDVSALADPNLGLIKNQILETVNRRLGKHILREVVFSDYSFLER
ncbi:MAG: hypothetical protein PVH19_09315 [Planctomycetia bacterium]|jgi:hypothetical protein